MIRGYLLFLTFAALVSAPNVSAQDSAKKQLTARELFYAAAQAPPAAPRASRPPAKSAPRPARPAPKTEIARAETRVPDSPRQDAPQPPTPAATAPMPPSGSAPPLGLRYTVLRLAADNSGTEVPADTVFHSGDRIRFSIEANAPGYLYIINQGSSGNWKPVFPSAEIEDGNNRIEGWRPYTMPPKSRLAFDSTVGTENLFIVFSLQPENDLEGMIYSLQGRKKPAAAAAATDAPVQSSKELIVAANISNSAVDRMRAAWSRDLIVEKVDLNTTGDKKETAVYVVNPTGSADSRVVADLHLVHQ
jgi:hypothetical protein